MIAFYPPEMRALSSGTTWYPFLYSKVSTLADMQSWLLHNEPKMINERKMCRKQ